MHPYLLQEIARQREEDLRRAARHYSPAGRPGKRRRGRLLAGAVTVITGEMPLIAGPQGRLIAGH
jgi:hypothetical protein